MFMGVTPRALLPALLGAVLALTACAPGQVARPSDSSAPADSASPATTDPVRPFRTMPAECDQLMPAAELAGLAGASLSASPADPDGSDDLFSEAYRYAGGDTCTWASDTATATLSVVPDALEEWRLIQDAFQTGAGTPPEVSGYCAIEVCEWSGFVDGYWAALSLTAPSIDETLDETPVTRALHDRLSAMGAPTALPPVSSEWTDGPSDCEGFASAGLSSEFGVMPDFSHGFGYEGSNAWAAALLAANGFTCRVEFGGLSATVSVLPGASAEPPSGSVPQEPPVALTVPGAGAAWSECWSNGSPEPWSPSSTGSCTIDMSARTAWVRVVAYGLDVPRSSLHDEALRLATAVAAPA